ncbi:SpaH/EbpB family LPXTG-anchored major pilin [uncultured Gemmiger sp.]|uniref:SpaH/EbpB family LPXTG-anchored major pilin n=1 Tax=uncultured Gemmiger sp. TaxID=1623490 RepID=UPI0025E5B1F1|nr:SpaH/EbpB family LPXTG-anchored major pilin [uncultured Gemmiger sp.]
MKLKRFFTGVLSAVMALSVCALPAAAADDNATTGAATTSKYTTSTIDTGKEGSITIYKRSMTSKLPTEPAGKGETTAPEGEPLENVGFTIYQVMDAGELVKYYDGITEGNAVTYKDYFDSDATEFTASTLRKDVISKEVKDPGEKSGEKKTGVDGKVEFTGLKVGLYLVIETNLPQAVTQKADPFLVSIPMTRIGAGKDETENPNNKVWMYDVTVYPKNSIAQGDVTLEKKGVTGSDTANAVSLDGVKFTLYRKSDTDGTYTPVANCTDKATENGQIQFSNLRKGSYYIMETGYADKADAGYILDTKAKYAFAIDKDGKVAENTDLTGADVVNGTKGVFDIDPTASKLTVYNYKPDVEKTVTKRDGSSTVTNTDGTTVGNHEADYGVDDKVTYTLTIDVPANITKLKTFTVTDTTVAKQLVHDAGSVTVSAKNKDKEVENIPSAYGEADIKCDDTNSVLTIAFTPANLGNVAGGQVTITYTATVQKNAVVAGGGNVNSAKLQYSRTTDTTKEEEGGNKPYEIEDQSVVYTFSTSLLKKGEGGTYGDKAMPNVTFELYKKVENSEWKNDAVTIAGKSYQKKDVVRPEDIVALGLSKDKTETWIKITYDGKDEGTTGPDGKLTYTGLPKGTYRFVETKTLNGYNLLSKPVDAKLNQQYETEWTTSTTYVGGKLEKNKYSMTTYTGDAASTTDNPITIINRSGFTLPVTGGFGTLLFSGIGVLLVLAGVAVLFSMKKKNDRA